MENIICNNIVMCKECGKPMELDYETRDDLILTEYIVCRDCGHETRRVWTLTLCADTE